MRIMVTGSREWRDIKTLANALEGQDPGFYIGQITLLHGCASGADAIARSLAVARGNDVEDFWPDYDRYDFATANKKRNLLMVEYDPDVCLAFPTKSSRGTWHAVHAAEKAGIPVKVFEEAK